MGRRRTFVEVDYPSESAGLRPSIGRRVLEVVRSPTVVTVLLTFLFSSSAPWWGQPVADTLRPLLLLTGMGEQAADMVMRALGAMMLVIATFLLIAFVALVYKGLDEDVLAAQRREIALNRLAMLAWTVRSAIEVDDRLADIAHSTEAYRGFLSKVAAEAERVFSVLVKEGRVGIAIRLLTQDDSGASSFPTFARAGNLSAKRDLESTPLTVQSGVIEIATSGEESSDAVFFINNARGAFDSGVLSRDFNSENEPYASEVLSMAFTRINLSERGLDGRDHDELVGIFYVTSDAKNAFDGIITSYMVLIADMLSLFLKRADAYLVDEREPEGEM